MRPISRRVMALLGGGVLAMVCAAPADADPVPPEGSIYGTLLWTSDEPPAFRARFCEGTHSDRFDGLADVVVVAEPLDAAAKRVLLATHSDMAGQDGDSELDWYDDRLVVGKADPRSKLTISNLAAGPRTLRILDGTKLVRELVIASMSDADVTALPEGVLRVTAVEQPGSEGWIYVTPWPSSVTAGNCRWSFEVPFGRYVVKGWHPFGGERTVACSAAKTRVPPPCALTFDARVQK
jgi:hypothetical protein